MAVELFLSGRYMDYAEPNRYVMFGGNHIITAILGIVVGILMLYLPEKNLKALERL